MNIGMLTDLEVERLRHLSEKGSSDASLTLAENARAIGDLTEAERMYRRSIDLGSSAAAMALANFYEKELKNNAEAVYWYKAACKSGNELACTYLSIAYMGGLIGLPIDNKLSRKYIELASQNKSQGL